MFCIVLCANALCCTLRSCFVQCYVLMFCIRCYLFLVVLSASVSQNVLMLGYVLMLCFYFALSLCTALCAMFNVVLGAICYLLCYALILCAIHCAPSELWCILSILTETITLHCLCSDL